MKSEKAEVALVVQSTKRSWKKERVMMSKRLGWLIRLTIACGLLVYASPDTSWAGEAGRTQGVTKDSIKIGMFAPFSGPASIYGKTSHMVEALYRDVNEKGGINGRKLELVIDDSAGDPTNAAMLIKKQVERDKVFMIHAETVSNVVIAALPVVKETGVPFLPQGPATSKITEPPVRNVFAALPSTREMARTMADFVKSMKAKTVMVIAQKDEWGQSWYEPLMAGLKESGATLVADEKMESTIGDATALVRIGLRSKPDVIVLITYPQPTSVFLRDAYSQGLKGPFVSSAGAQVDEQVERVGGREPVLPLITVFNYLHPVSSPVYDKYRNLLKKYYPNDMFDATSMFGIIGTQVNIEVLRRMGNSLTWENWIKTMEGIKGFPSDTRPGPVNFKPFQPNDPSCRRGLSAAALATLNPDPAVPASTPMIFTDWEGYQKALGKR